MNEIYHRMKSHASDLQLGKHLNFSLRIKITTIHEFTTNTKPLFLLDFGNYKSTKMVVVWSSIYHQCDFNDGFEGHWCLTLWPPKHTLFYLGLFCLLGE